MSAKSAFRVLLLDPAFSPDLVPSTIEAYLQLNRGITVNTFGWSPAERASILQHFGGMPEVGFENVDPNDPAAVEDLVTRGSRGFDAIICPTDGVSISATLLHPATHSELSHPLRAIGTPNDSLSHLTHLRDTAASLRIGFVNVAEMHADSVAEYTLGQIYFHARRLAAFYEATGRNGAFPHESAARTTRLVANKTLGILGGSGKDGVAIVTRAVHAGIKVIALASGSEIGKDRMRAAGAQLADDLPTLLAAADFLSINCRKNAETTGLIGRDAFAAMRAGLIIVNPAGAEIIDRAALLEELRRPAGRRKLETLILDMPYGGRRDATAFACDPVNTELKALGVLFTPRMAGYTIDSEVRGARTLARNLVAFLNKGSAPAPDRHVIAPVVNPALIALRDQMVRLAREAGALAIRLRDSGLYQIYNDDGSPTTNADLASEALIRTGLRETGYSFRFEGEESSEEKSDSTDLEIVVDGIDGTRNFRDWNYGWCVSLAARQYGRTIIGVVHDPQNGDTYVAEAGKGAMLINPRNTKPFSCPETIATDFSFSVGSFRVAGSTAKKAQVIADIKELGGREREWGCVALSICAVARGGLGIFIQGNSKVHDHVAALLVATEAGAGVEVIGEGKRPMVDVIVSHPSLHAKAVSIFHERSASATIE